MCVHGKIVAGLVGTAMVLEAVALAAFCYGRGLPELERPAIVSVAGARTSKPKLCWARRCRVLCALGNVSVVGLIKESNVQRTRPYPIASPAPLPSTAQSSRAIPPVSPSWIKMVAASIFLY